MAYRGLDLGWLGGMRPQLFQNYPVSVSGDTGLDVRRQAEIERAARAQEEGAAAQRGLLARQLGIQQEGDRMRAATAASKLVRDVEKEKNELFRALYEAMARNDYQTARQLSNEIDRRRYDETVLWQDAGVRAPEPEPAAPAAPAAAPTEAPATTSPEAPAFISAKQAFGEARGKAATQDAAARAGVEAPGPQAGSAPALPRPMGPVLAAPPAPDARQGSNAAPAKTPFPVAGSTMGLWRRPEFKVVARDTGRVTASDDEAYMNEWQGQAIGQAFAGVVGGARNASERSAALKAIEKATGLAEAMPVDKAIIEGFRTYDSELGRDVSTTNARIGASGRRPEDKLLQPYEVGRESMADFIKAHHTDQLNEQLGMLAQALRNLASGTELSKADALKALIRVHEDRISNMDYAIAARSDGLDGYLASIKEWVFGSAKISPTTMREATQTLLDMHKNRRIQLEGFAQSAYDRVMSTPGRKWGTRQDWEQAASNTAKMVYPEWDWEATAKDEQTKVNPELDTGGSAAPSGAAPAEPSDTRSLKDILKARLGQ